MTEHVTVCDQAYDPSTTPKYDLHSVSSLTTYQLRQELVRLGAFERFFPPEKVQYCCYDSLLEAHITLLREAKAEEEAAAFAKHNAEVEARKAQLAEAKAARKKEAEERSRLRREAQKAALDGDAAPGDATPNPGQNGGHIAVAHPAVEARRRGRVFDDRRVIASWWLCNLIGTI